MTAFDHEPGAGGGAAAERGPRQGLPSSARQPLLVPDVERAIETSAQSNPAVLVTAISPFVGRAVLRCMREWLRGLLERVNYRILRSISLRGVRLRWEAFRRGVSFDQILTEHEVIGLVEQAFLIHRDSGLLLAETMTDGCGARDGDMVSGMLTAIQTFVQESFKVSAGERLDSVQVGSVTVWIEQGSQALLAAVVRGRRPEHLQATCRSVLDRIHIDWANALLEFSGDTTLFRGTKRFLKQCLVAAEGRVSGRILPMTWIVLAALILAPVFWIYSSLDARVRWQACLQQIAARPGIVITEAGRRDGKFYVAGLLDPLAAGPHDIFVMSGIREGDVISTWKPYQALASEFIILRVRRLLNPPSTVSLVLAGDVLIANGSADTEWIANTKILSRGFVGISRFDTSGLLDVDAAEHERWDNYLERLAGIAGIVVTSTGKERQTYHVAGLRDPRAPDPDALLQEFGLTPEKVTSRWEPYIALLPPYILQRAHLRLAPPESVELALEGDRLTISGEARHAWVSEVEMRAMGIAGVAVVDFSELTDLDLREIEIVQARIEGRVFMFLDDIPDLWPDQAAKISRLAKDIELIADLVRQIDGSVTIEVRGHTDATGDEKTEQSASEAIAQRFAVILVSRTVDQRLVRYRGMGAVPPEHPDPSNGQRNRCASLKVLLGHAP